MLHFKTWSVRPLNSQKVTINFFALLCFFGLPLLFGRKALKRVRLVVYGSVLNISRVHSLCCIQCSFNINSASYLVNRFFNINSLENSPEHDFVKIMSDQNDFHETNFFSNVTDSPYNSMSFNTVYSSIIDYKCHVNNDISIMTFNIQSLNYKFNELKELVYTLNCNNCEPDIICLQELWQFPLEAEFLLPGYKPLIYKLRRGNTQGGGVGIYVKKDIDYSINSKVYLIPD